MAKKAVDEASLIPKNELSSHAHLVMNRKEEGMTLDWQWWIMNSKGLYESKRSRRRTTGLGLGLQEELEEETMSWEGEVVRQGIVKGIYREYTTQPSSTDPIIRDLGVTVTQSTDCSSWSNRTCVRRRPRTTSRLLGPWTIRGCEHYSAVVSCEGVVRMASQMEN